MAAMLSLSSSFRSAEGACSTSSNGVCIRSTRVQVRQNVSVRKRRRWLAFAMPEGGGNEAMDLGVAQVASGDGESTPEEEDLESVQQILRVLEILRKNRDMTPNEVRLTVMIEDPRQNEFEEPLCSRDDMADALQEIIDGKVPKDRLVLQALKEEMLAWPNLDEMIEKKDLRQSRYAQITDTGVSSTVAAQRANVDWDQAAEFSPEEQKELGDELPPAVGYSFLYLVTLVPLIIGFAVVAILFVNSFQ